MAFFVWKHGWWRKSNMRNLTFPVKISIIQGAGLSEDKSANLKRILAEIDQVSQHRPDFIVFSEMATTPYFIFGARSRAYLEWAEPIPGPATQAVGERARHHHCTIVLPVFERGSDGNYYNSAVVIGPDGDMIEGVLHDGRRVNRYAKAHLGKTVYPSYVGDENIYLTPGPGLAVFDTPKAKIGILICFDRHFPEAWRTLTLMGAEIIFLPLAAVSYPIGKNRPVTIEDQFEKVLCTRALDNLVYVIACNKAGPEKVGDNKLVYFGRSCIIDPTGIPRERLPANEPAMITASIDLNELTEARKTFLFYEIRRPTCYLPITEGRSL
jgi:predicted amidohydrolase